LRAIIDEPAYVGDGVVEQQIGAARRDPKGLVQVRARSRVQRDERQLRPIDDLTQRGNNHGVRMF
jgi:hypothetical protein